MQTLEGLGGGGVGKPRRRSLDYISHKPSQGGDPTNPPLTLSLAAAHKVLKGPCWGEWAVTRLSGGGG